MVDCRRCGAQDTLCEGCGQFMCPLKVCGRCVREMSDLERAASKYPATRARATLPEGSVLPRLEEE